MKLNYHNATHGRFILLFHWPCLILSVARLYREVILIVSILTFDLSIIR